MPCPACGLTTGFLAISVGDVVQVKVVKIDKERNLLVLRGAVPGAINGLLLLRQAGKGQKGK